MAKSPYALKSVKGKGSRVRSLRVRIILFAALVCLILLTLVGVVISVLRSTQSATLKSAEGHLHKVAASLAKTYKTDPSYSLNLARLDEPRLHPPKHPEPGSEQAPAPGPPPPPPPRVANGPLEHLMTSALLSEEGIEGGFYRLDNGALGGYSFPTHEAPGPMKEMPVRERPTIEEIARSAATTGAEQKQRFQGQHDAVLFDAIPLRSSDAANSPVIGAAWFMQRLPGAETQQHRQLLWGAFGFASMALLICAAAYVILSEVRGGLRSVSARLAGVVSGVEMPASNTKALAEFDGVLSGIDQMARDLQQKSQRERSLVAQIAHQERLAAVGQFAAGIAHELRNPLATIRLRTQMTQQADADGLTAKNTQVVLTEIDRLNAMIGKLLHFARPVQMHEDLLDLATVARDRVQRWNEEYGAGSVQFDEPEQPIIVSGDGEEVRQVFDNLLENALQAATTQGRLPLVEVSIHLSGADAVVNVVDHGSGFDEESLRKALEPFYTTKERGTGLGLAIVNEIIRAHGGVVHLDNRREGGGAVRFQIPAHSPDPAAEIGKHG